LMTASITNLTTGSEGQPYREACLREPECKGWVLVKDGGVCWLKGRWAGRPESDDCCVGADSRPGAEGYMREAASRTAELVGLDTTFPLFTRVILHRSTHGAIDGPCNQSDTRE
jgi:hypothetical protein